MPNKCIKSDFQRKEVIPAKELQLQYLDNFSIYFLR